MNDVGYLQFIDEYNSSSSLKRGDIIKGQVIEIDNNMALVNVQYNIQAICPKDEVDLSLGQTLFDIFKIDETYNFSIDYLEDDVLYLSYKKASLSGNFEIIEKKFKNQESVNGKIVNISKGGLTVEVLGMKGFVPINQVGDIESELEIDKIIELKIISLDIKNNSFILSHKRLYQKDREIVQNEILDIVKPHMIVRGTVVRLMDFGAFLDLGGIDGLLPLSQISWGWIEKPSDMLSIGDRLDVEIMRVDKERKKISLSLKSIQESPWDKAKDIVKKGQIIKAEIKRIKDIGAFIEIYSGVEGFLFKTQVMEYYKKTKKELRVNDRLTFRVSKCDFQNKKINLEIVYSEL